MRAVVAAVALLSGCSFLAATEHHPDPHYCSSLAWPILDTALATVGVPIVIGAWTSGAPTSAGVADGDVADGFGNIALKTGAVVLAIPTAIFAASAIYGYVTTTHCLVRRN